MRPARKSSSAIDRLREALEPGQLRELLDRRDEPPKGVA